MVEPVSRYRLDKIENSLAELHRPNKRSKPPSKARKFELTDKQYICCFHSLKLHILPWKLNMIYIYIYIYFAELLLSCLVLLDWYNRTSYTNWGCRCQHSFCAAHWGRLEFQYYGEHDTASFELMWIFAIIVKTRIQFLSQGIVHDWVFYYVVYYMYIYVLGLYNFFFLQIMDLDSSL